MQRHGQRNRGCLFTLFSRVFRLTEVRDCRRGQKQTGQGHRGQTALQAEQESVPESLSGSE